MRLYRIASLRFPIFDGTGAFLRGARWNSPGQRVIYASESLSCARLEILAHSGRTARPTTHASIEIDVPDDVAVETVSPTALPAGWDAVPDRHYARRAGDAWLNSKTTLLLRVPSVASANDFNVLINQEHADFHRLKASEAIAISWDDRLFEQ